MEARLTWVRLNAELKNWRKVGRESLAFLEEERERKRERERDKILRNTGQRERRAEQSMSSKDGVRLWELERQKTKEEVRE